MTKRLSAICGELPRVGTLCDVGCDHGYIALYAAEKKLCDRLIVTDISADSLKKAELLLSGRGYDYISVVTDGVKDIKYNIDCAVICGMGGREIIKILQERKIDQLVLQPMKDIVMLREFLASDYCIDKDYITQCQGKFYDIITAHRGSTQLTEYQKFFGNGINQNTNEFMAYARYLRSKIHNIIDGVPEERKRELLHQLELISEVINSDCK